MAVQSHPSSEGTTMSVILCIDCEEPITLGPNVRVGQRLLCPHCAAELEVISLSPLQLDWALDESGQEWEGDEEDDWEDEEEWEDEDDDWEDELLEDDEDEDHG
jgi:hypothetical protein